MTVDYYKKMFLDEKRIWFGADCCNFNDFYTNKNHKIHQKKKRKTELWNTWQSLENKSFVPEMVSDLFAV